MRNLITYLNFSSLTKVSSTSVSSKLVLAGFAVILAGCPAKEETGGRIFDSVNGQAVPDAGEEFARAQAAEDAASARRVEEALATGLSQEQQFELEQKRLEIEDKKAEETVKNNRQSSLDNVERERQKTAQEKIKANQKTTQAMIESGVDGLTALGNYQNGKKAAQAAEDRAAADLRRADAYADGQTAAIDVSKQNARSTQYQNETARMVALAAERERISKLSDQEAAESFEAEIEPLIGQNANLTQELQQVQNDMDLIGSSLISKEDSGRYSQLLPAELADKDGTTVVLRESKTNTDSGLTEIILTEAGKKELARRQSEMSRVFNDGLDLITENNNRITETRSKYSKEVQDQVGQRLGVSFQDESSAPRLSSYSFLEESPEDTLADAGRLEGAASDDHDPLAAAIDSLNEALANENISPEARAELQEKKQRLESLKGELATLTNPGLAEDGTHSEVDTRPGSKFSQIQSEITRLEDEIREIESTSTNPIPEGESAVAPTGGAVATATATVTVTPVSPSFIGPLPQEGSSNTPAVSQKPAPSNSVEDIQAALAAATVSGDDEKAEELQSLLDNPGVSGLYGGSSYGGIFEDYQNATLSCTKREVASECDSLVPQVDSNFDKARRALASLRGDNGPMSDATRAQALSDLVAAQNALRAVASRFAELSDETTNSVSKIQYANSYSVINAIASDLGKAVSAYQAGETYNSSQLEAILTARYDDLEYRHGEIAGVSISAPQSTEGSTAYAQGDQAIINAYLNGGFDAFSDEVDRQKNLRD